MHRNRKVGVPICSAIDFIITRLIATLPDQGFLLLPLRLAETAMN
jgi:hypothetical protein